jgi:hypothetical protein
MKKPRKLLDENKEKEKTRREESEEESITTISYGKLLQKPSQARGKNVEEDGMGRECRIPSRCRYEMINNTMTLCIDLRHCTADCRWLHLKTRLLLRRLGFAAAPALCYGTQNDAVCHQGCWLERKEIVHDLNPGKAGSFPFPWVTLEGERVFLAFTSRYGRELWCLEDSFSMAHLPLAPRE